MGLAVGVLVLLLVSAIIGGGAWLGRSEGGSAWLLAQVPGLKVEGLKGSLLGNRLSADRLTYATGGSALELRGVLLEGLHGDWTTRPMPGEPWLHIGLDTLGAAEARWRSGPPSGTPAAAPADLRLPVSLSIGQARVGRLQVDDGPVLTALQADQLALGDGRGARHRVQSFSVRSERWQAQARAEIGADAPMTLGLHAQVRSEGDVGPPWQATVQLDGPLARLQARAHLAGRDAGGPALDADATLAPFAPWPLPELNLRTQALDLSALQAGAPQTKLRGQARIRTSGLKEPAEAEATLTNDAPGRWDQGRLPLRHLQISAQGEPRSLGELTLKAFSLELGGEAPGGELSGSGALAPAAGSEPGEKLSLKLALAGLRPAALDKRLPAMTLAGPVALELDGLPAWETAPADKASAPVAAASAASSTGASVMDRWRARIDAKLDGRLDPPAPPPAPAGAKKKSTAPAPPPQPVTLPAVQLALQATVDAREAILSQALARSGDASARVSGRVAFGAAERPWSWQAKGELKDFEPRVWWPGAPATGRRGANRLNATLASEGRWHAPGSAAPAWTGLDGQVDATIQPSQWAGLPLQGELNARREAAGTASLQGRVEIAGNRVSGTAQDGSGRAREVTLRVEAPALTALAPWLSGLAEGDPLAWLPRAGTLQADASARWATADAAPQWQGQLRASALTHPAWQARRLEARAEGTGLGSTPLHATVSGEGLGWQVATADKLQAELQGSLAEHRFDLSLLSPARPPVWAQQVLGAHSNTGTRLQLAATGRWQPAVAGGRPLDAGRWQGRLQQIQGSAGDGSGQPWLAGQDLALGVAWNDDGQLVEAQADPGRLVLPGTALRWSEARWHAGAGPGQLALKAQLEAFEIAPLLARAQPELGWKGDLVLGADINVVAGDRFDADVVFQRQRGDLSVADEVRDTTTAHRALGLTDLRLALAAHDGTWHFTAGLAGRQLGEMAGVASVRTTPQARWPGPEAPLEGTFQLHVAQLGAWGAWVPPGWRLGGDLQSAATLGGRWGSPEFSGRLTGRQLEVRNGLQGVQLNDGMVDVSLRGDHAQIERFSWRGGDGTLTVTGEASLGSEPQAELKLQADKLRVLGRLDRRLIASGQATLALKPQSANLSGRLRVDEGLIDFSRAGAPTLDEDVRVVGAAPVSTTAEPANGAGATPGAEQRDLATKLDIALDLGPALRIKGRGIDTFLRGTLQITNPGKQLAVRGDVRAERGTYRAYGQKLEIERGLLSFVGPVEDPRLDILAVRPNLDVQVGVAVSGSALNPRVKLYSDQDMSDTDKLSWLMLGRASDGLGRADTALLQRAALALLAGEGESPTDTFLSAIGLSDFGVRQTGEGTEQTTTVSLGKQLSRRWYVGYERSINATAGTWQLIYRVAQRFTVRAQSGEDSALDLIWSWRWN
ncbi:translocation/assembly module TamB domain-containing protein [Ideonella sp. YS5]|uniref:translocation/assembly module TamB domain-containing protein n=1 Tax=Ideonella sp. YS5 TaxID=3453714 RepID=UPI003EE85F69